MKICDLIDFSKETYFNGAVQTEWFYDPTRIEKIAGSYVFHGPKYYGVTSSDVTRTKHQLVDTASFTKMISDKLYASDDSMGNNFVMTIAGYGTGKSHLAVCLGALFSGNNNLAEIITNHIENADKSIGEHIRAINKRHNIIIALNGMNNFNLDAEVLKSARRFLIQNGSSDEVLRSITKSYDVAKHFVEKNYELHRNSFTTAAHKHVINCPETEVKSYLLQHVEDDKEVIEVINEVYKEITGDTIHWDRGISAGDIISILQKELCGANKPFNKVLILFDEFGRYIEYAAANPSIAGEASLQQIFEAVQDANGRVIFAGFIQNDLNAYLSRIDKTANIIRYVGRYENSEKYYLSSNFETILANLLKKNETAGFSRIIGNALNRYDSFHKKVFSALCSWDKASQKKGVWTSFEMYKSVILTGCYPIHPITVWLLSNTSNWMQQRSTIAFAEEMVNSVKQLEIEGTWLPYVYPIDIVDSNIFNEMLNSEEKGLVQSQFCMLYRDIILKIGNKLSDDELKILKAILIINICHFSFRGRDDALLAIRYCSNLKEEVVEKTLKSLEDMHGVIAFDDKAMTFDLIAEANGFNEFKRIYIKYRIGTKATIDEIDEDLTKEASLSGVVETSFAQEHNISSTEWVFERKLCSVEEISVDFLMSLKRKLDLNYSGEEPRGIILYAYCSNNSEEQIKRVTNAIVNANVKSSPIIILFLDDASGEIINALTIKKSLLSFSKADQERFAKHISSQLHIQNKAIVQRFNSLIAQRMMISENGLTQYNCRISVLCTNAFVSLFSSAPPFAFDGFQNKTTTQAKKYLSNICIKLFDKTLTNIQSYQSLTQDEKNRVKSCLSVGVPTSWQVFDSKCSLTEPKNNVISSICNDIEEALSADTPKAISLLIDKYLHAPYGMNINSVALLTFYFIANHGNTIYSYFGDEKLLASHLSDKIFKGSKIQLSEFRKIKLQINEHAEIDQVAELCKRIINTSDISDCVLLRSKLNDLLKQEGITPSNQPIVAEATMRMDEGSRILKGIAEKNDKARELIEESKKSFKIHVFCRVFDYYTDTDKPLSEEYDFVCGDVLKSTIEKIKTDVRSILQQKFTSAISRFKCEITQLSQVKNLYKKIADTLERYGYSEYANETRARIVALEEELLAQQKYQATLTELEKDITLCSGTQTTSYRAVLEMQSKMVKWKEFIETAKEMPSSISTPLIIQINSILDDLETKHNDYQQRFCDVVDQIAKATTIDDLIDSKRLLERLLVLEYDDETTQKIEAFIKDLSIRIERIRRIPDNLDALIESIRLYEHSDDAVLSKELLRRQEQYEALEEGWIDENIIITEKSIDTLSAAQCIKWLDNSEKLPSYLRAETKSRYALLKPQIEARLRKCRVDGVVSMFQNLSDAEKSQCLEILINLR